MKEFYITDKQENCIIDIDEATINPLEESKNCHQFRLREGFKYKVEADFEFKKRTKEEAKIKNIFFNTDYIINNAINEYGVYNQWLGYDKKIYEADDYELDFPGLKSIQINVEPTEASIGRCQDLPLDLKNSKSILNIQNRNYNCFYLAKYYLGHIQLKTTPHVKIIMQVN